MAIILYVEGLSEAISRVLCKVEVKTALVSNAWRGKLTGKVKDKIDVLDHPGVVYKIGCHTCTKAYIGETGRTAKVRGKEHNACFRNGRLQLSAGAEHASMGHQVIWEPQVINRE